MDKRNAETDRIVWRNLSTRIQALSTTLIASASFLAMLLTSSGAFIFRDSLETVEMVYSISSVLMIFVLISYILFKSHQKPQRYAPAIGYLQEANRIVKKQFAALALPDDVKKMLEVDKDPVSDILSIAATTFTMITGKRCFCSVKEFVRVNGVDSIRVISTDPLSHERELPLGSTFPIKDFSSLTEIIKGKNTLGVSIKNNLCKARNNEGYHNPLFAIYETSKDGEWPLPHKSSMVVPISHIIESSIYYEGGGDGKIEQQGKNYTHVWGFLCVHCESTNVFDLRYSPQLARAFSDLLYIILNLSKLKLNTDKKIP